MITNFPPCPLCGSSYVTVKYETIEVENLSAEVRYATCDECGAEVRPDDDDLSILKISDFI